MATYQNSDSLLRIVLVVLAVIILAPILMMVLAFPLFGMWGGGMMSGFDGSGVAPMWGFAIPLVWLAILLGGGYILYRGIVGSRSTRSDPARDELRLAYARGDLSDEEFEERQSKLNAK
jgi:putative membrane protein